MVKDGTGRLDLVIAAAFVVLASGALGQAAGLLLLGAVSLIGLGAGRLLLRRLPGLTGDSYGALSELGELAALALLPLCWRLAST
jgi:cobalamin synthase